jgi:PAS domain S-box-containing protein
VLFYFYYHLSRRLRKEIQQKEISQRNLAEKESLYRSILKASPDDVTITDLHGVIKEVSLKALTLVGCDSEEQMIGKSIADFVHPDDVGRALSSGRALLKGEEFEQGEYRLLRKDGTYIDTEINADLIKDPHGNAGGIVMVIRDISERKTHEAELQEKNAELIRFNAEKDKFFSIIAHDLRSPFNAFLGLTQMLSEDVGDMQHNEIQNLANTLNKSATNLLRLLENLLQWARMERGLTIPKPANFSLNKLIEETLSVFLDSAKYKDVAVTTDLAKDSIVFSDYDMTKTIIRNLLSNALKYTHTGGKISLSTTALENGFIKVTVKDNGIGMTQQIMDNLFSIDIDNRRPGTEGESSTGLGLVLCKEFVEANGGNLFVSSEEDKGSSFEFTLPQATKIQD